MLLKTTVKNKTIQLLKALLNLGFKEHLEVNLICPLQGLAFNSLKYAKVKGVSSLKTLAQAFDTSRCPRLKARINFSSQ